MQPLQAAIAKLREKQQELSIGLRPPAICQAIEAFEAAFQTTLPAGIKKFYEYCDGFEAADHWFQLLPLVEMIRESWKDKDGRQWIALAEYFIYIDQWNIVLTPESATGYQIVGNDHRTQEPVILTDSITDFILRYLESSTGDGAACADALYAWHDEITGASPA